MDIPSQYNPKDVESKVYDQCLKQGCFEAKIDPKKSSFTIVIPPPNVTGILHMGHALNNTLQDVLIRFKRMQGCEALWMPGTDHAGIATQNMVEKSLAKEKLKKEDIGRAEFLKRLWAWTDENGTTILTQLKKLGASCDWDRTRFTMDNAYSQAVRQVFVHLYEKDLIYRGKYIINWCPRCKTALSDEESPHHELDGWLYYIKYPVIRAGNSKPDANDYVVVATTRPETMLGDTAVAINPDDKRYQYLKKAKVILPIVGRELKVVVDEAVDLSFGTGVVKVTPAHDPVDFTLGKKYDLDFINIMNDDATLNNEVPDEFCGLDRFEARENLLELLEKKKLIDKKEPYKVSAGHCYRCHTIIEPRISPQWFVKMKPLAEPAIKVVEKGEVKFTPERWKKVYLNWMNNINDWCISRQIWWGHRIPAYYCKNCSDQEDSQKGIIVSLTRPQKCPDCGSLELTQDNDVLDTWFSSWLWPFATFYWPFGETLTNRSKIQEQGKNLTSSEKIVNRDPQTFKKELNYFYPTGVLVTASEILFFWVARMIMASLEFQGKIPFKDVLIHGTVRDQRGVKMSKSLGNIIDPLEIIDKFGSDSLRFSLMMLAASGSDVYLSDDKFLVGRNFCNKIWNATRFVLIKTDQAQIKINDLNLNELDPIDHWILDKLNDTIRSATQALESFTLNDAVKTIYDFFWHYFCDWYLEIVKDKFSENKAKTLIYVLSQSMKLLSPFMPFITEEVTTIIADNTHLKKENSLCLSTWPKPIDFKLDVKSAKSIASLLDTVKEIRNIKADLGLATAKLNLEVKTSGNANKIWEDNLIWIKRLTMSSDILISDNLSRVLYKNELWEINLAADNLDMSNFLATIDKKVSSLSSILDKSNQRLNNEKFVKNAAEEKVAQEKLKNKDILNQVNRLKILREAFK